MSNKYDNIMQQLRAEPIDGQSILMSEAQLDKWANELGFPLPADYREFLRCYGEYAISGCAKFPLKPNVDDRSFGLIETFFGGPPDEMTLQDGNHNCFWAEDMSWDFLPDTGIELVRYYPPGTKAIKWPKELLIIGEDPGGNSTCLAISGLRPGAVFCWMTSGDVYLAADSFDEFMHSLSVEED